MNIKSRLLHHLQLAHIPCAPFTYNIDNLSQAATVDTAVQSNLFWTAHDFFTNNNHNNDVIYLWMHREFWEGKLGTPEEESFVVQVTTRPGRIANEENLR